LEETHIQQAKTKLGLKSKFNWAKCISHSALNHKCRLKTSYPTQGNSQTCPIVGHGIQFKYRNTTKISKQISSNSMLFDTSPTVLHRDLNVSYFKDEVRRLSQRYADILKEHPNILTTNLMRNAETICRLKRPPLLQDLCT
jgi:hypothetical protein